MSVPEGERSRGLDPRRVWKILGLVTAVGIAALVSVWLLSRGPDDVVLQPPAPGAPDISFSGSFPKSSAPLRNPRGIDGDGTKVWVAEADGARILSFTAEGRPLDPIPLPPLPSGAAAYPVDVAVFGGGLAVVDTAGRRVLLISAAGVARPGDGITSLDASTAPRLPTSCVASAEELFVADAADHTIRVYGRDGRLRRRLGVRMSPRLTYVSGMALDGSDLYVCDTNAGRVVVLDADSGGQRRVLIERFQLARDVAVAEGGHVFVADTFGRAVAVLDRQGRRVDEIGPRGVSPGGGDLRDYVSRPEGVWWDAAERRLLATDAEFGDVRAFNVRIP